MSKIAPMLCERLSQLLRQAGQAIGQAVEQESALTLSERP
jgi:hypothetical protein